MPLSPDFTGYFSTTNYYCSSQITEAFFKEENLYQKFLIEADFRKIVPATMCSSAEALS